MGLDSVELIIGFEKYFEFDVPNKEAEKVRTVQDMIDCVARHLSISSNDTSLKDDIFKKLKSVSTEAGLADSLSLSDYIFSFINPLDKDQLAKVSQQLGLKIPDPYIETDGIIKRFFSIVRNPLYDWKAVTVDQFITAVCANNYDKLLDRKALKSTYEIFVAIVAITVDKIGVDFYEVQPDKEFVSDFGID